MTTSLLGVENDDDGDERREHDIIFPFTRHGLRALISSECDQPSPATPSVTGWKGKQSWFMWKGMRDSSTAPNVVLPFDSIKCYFSFFLSLFFFGALCLVLFTCRDTRRRKKSKNRTEQQSEEEVTEEPHHLEHDSPGSSNSKSSSTQQQQSGANLRSAATSLIVTASHLLLYLPALLLLGLQVSYDVDCSLTLPFSIELDLGDEPSQMRMMIW